MNAVPQITGLLDHRGAPISTRQIAEARMAAFHVRGSGRYGAGPGGERRQAALAGWTPALRTMDGVHAYSRDATNARVRDLYRTNGSARAAVIKDADMIVGQLLRLMSLPDATALGISVKTAQELGKAQEAVFRSWAHDPLRRCDRVRRHQFPGLANVLYREFRTIGDSLYVVRMKRRERWRFGTAIQIVNAERLSNPNGTMDTLNTQQGVQLDDDGEAIGYHIRNGHPGGSYVDYRNQVWEYVPKETSWGRPVCVHGFETEEAGQVRGVSPFSAILEPFKMLDRQGHAELANHVANALYVGFLTSSYDPYTAGEQMAADPTGAAKDWHDIRAEHYATNEIVLGESVLPVLPPGDEIKLNATARQTSGIDTFRSVFLREIASALGVPYVALAEDWKSVTYSSARAALNEIWRSALSRRAMFVEQVITPIYYAVIEEAYAAGILVAPDGAPSFWDDPAAYLKGAWLGPGRGYIDRKKEAEGAEILKGAHMTTLQRELGDQGFDWEEHLQQEKREQDMLAELDLWRAAEPDAKPPAMASAVPDEDPDDADRRELAEATA